MLMREINKFKLTELRLTSLMDSFTLQMARFTIKQVTRLLSKFLLPKSKTGAIAESREPTGALKRRPRISMREPRDNRALCSCKRRRRTGATDKSTLTNGAMRKLRLDLTPKLLMINLFMRDQPRLLGKSMELNHQSQSSPLPKSKTGAIAELREPTGALKRRLKTLMREPRDNKALCSCKKIRRTGATDKSTLTNGAMRRLKPELILRLLMTSLSMRDQPRPPGKSMEPSHQFQSSLLLKSKTGVIVASRVPTGAPRRRPKISTREPRDNKVLCSLKSKRETGATVELRVPTGAPRRRPKISTREPRDNKVLCSLRETLRSKEPLRRRTGAIRVSTLIPGAIMRLRKD